MAKPILRRITSDQYEWYYRRYTPVIHKIISACNFHPSCRDDMMIIAGQGLLKAMEEYDPSRNVAFITFMYRRILGMLLNAKRAEQRQTRMESIDGDEDMPSIPAVVYDDLDSKVYVEEVLECLEPFERQVVTLSYGHEMSLRQVAAKMGCSYDKIWRVKREACRKLVKRWPDANLEMP